MSVHFAALSLTCILPLASLPAQQPGTRICLAPTSAKTTTGNTETAMTAVRETFTSFLTGPSLSIAPLTARLSSQVHEEAKLANCQYLLVTSVVHEHKQGNNFFKRAMAGAAEAGASQALGGAQSAGARVAAGAATSAAAAARNMSYDVKTKDELALTYRLERADGTVFVEKSEKRTAKSDGEDLLTPMVERASEAIVAAVSRSGGK